MSEKENENDIALGKGSSKADSILKWYSLFAAFLFLNLCVVGYAYYYKFYYHKNNSENASNTVITAPPDTVYVDSKDDETAVDDADNTDESDTKEVAEVVPVSHVERARELSFSVKSSDNGTSNKNTAANTSSNDGAANSANTNDVFANSALANANNANTSANKAVAAIPAKPSTSKGMMKNEEESHTFMISLGMFKDKDNAIQLVHDLKNKGIDGELIASRHFEKLPPAYLLVLAGKELSSASAYQMCAEMKKKGIDCSVQDGGKYSWK